MLETIDECIKHPNAEIQEAATRAARAFIGQYFRYEGASADTADRIVARYVKTLNTADVRARACRLLLVAGLLQ